MILGDQEYDDLYREFNARTLMPCWYVWTTDPQKQSVAYPDKGECMRCETQAEAGKVAAEWNAQGPRWPFVILETQCVRPDVFSSSWIDDDDSADDDEEQMELW